MAATGVGSVLLSGLAYSRYSVAGAGQMPFNNLTTFSVLNDVADLARSMSKQERDNPESEPMIRKQKADRKVAMMMGWFMAAGVRELFHPLWTAAGNWCEA